MHVDGTTSDMAQPFMFIGKPIRRLSDDDLRRSNMTRAQDDEIVARFARRFDAVMNSVKSGSYRVTIAGTEHMDFAARGNGETSRTIVTYLVAFLDKYVRGLPRPVLDGTPADPRVTLTRHGG
jgi:hypothetical protein